LRIGQELTERISFLNCLLQCGIHGFLLGLLCQFLASRLFQGVDQLLFVLEHVHAEFLLRRDKRVHGQAGGNKELRMMRVE